MTTYSDTRILDPNTGEVLDDALADRVARQSGATHKDYIKPGVYWRQVNGSCQAARFEGGPLEWQPTWHTYLPEWCEIF